MAKLGIYIPDNMVAEIECWRKKLNFSQIFRAALRRAIAEESVTKSTRFIAEGAYRTQRMKLAQEAKS